MASTATIIRDEPGAILVRIVHLDTDSFSRSVDRAATKAWKGTRNARTVSHVKGEYAYAYTDNPRECVSVVAYSTSFDRASAAIRDHLGAGR